MRSDGDVTINNATIVIIWQYISVSNQHIIYLESYTICQLYLNKFWEKYLSSV